MGEIMHVGGVVEIALVHARAFAFGTGTYSCSFVADRGRRLGVAFATATGGPGICSSSSLRFALRPRGALGTLGTGVSGTSSFCLRRPPTRAGGYAGTMSWICLGAGVGAMSAGAALGGGPPLPGGGGGFVSTPSAGGL